MAENVLVDATYYICKTLVTGLPVWQSQSENGLVFYWVASMAIPVGKWVGFVRFIFFSFFSVSVKVLPVNSLVSGVFVHRALCAYFLKIEG